MGAASSCWSSVPLDLTFLLSLSLSRSFFGISIEVDEWVVHTGCALYALYSIAESRFVLSGRLVSCWVRTKAPAHDS